MVRVWTDIALYVDNRADIIGLEKAIAVERVEVDGLRRGSRVPLVGDEIGMAADIENAVKNHDEMEFKVRKVDLKI